MKRAETYNCNDCGEKTHCSNGEVCLDCKNKNQEEKDLFRECKRPNCDRLANRKTNRGWCWVCDAGRKITMKTGQRKKKRGVY